MIVCEKISETSNSDKNVHELDCSDGFIGFYDVKTHHIVHFKYRQFI